MRGPSRSTPTLDPGWSAQLIGTSTMRKPRRSASISSSTSKPKPSVVTCGKSASAAAARKSLKPHWVSTTEAIPRRRTKKLNTWPESLRCRRTWRITEGSWSTREPTARSAPAATAASSRATSPMGVAPSASAMSRSRPAARAMPARTAWPLPRFRPSACTVTLVRPAATSRTRSAVPSWLPSSTTITSYASLYAGMTTDQRGPRTPPTGALEPVGRVGAAAAPGHARLLGGLRNLAGHRGRHLLVEDARDDVLGAQLGEAHAGGDGVGGRDLHLVVHQPRPGIEQPAEEAGEAEHVVDLVRVVGAAGSHHPHVALGLLRLDLGHRVRHREDDPVAGHALDVPHREHPRHRQADEHVRAPDGVGHPALDVAGIGRRGHPRLHEVHPDGTAPVDRP